jgi:hypothetical protein
VLDLGHFGGASIVTMAAVGGAHSVVASAEGNVFTWGRGFFGTHTPPPHTGFPMSAHLSRLRLFQQHLRSLFWVWVWVWDWVHTPPHTLLHTLVSFSPPSFHTISLSLAFTSALWAD